MRGVRRVLIALRPRAYREALAQVIKRARPLVAVHVLDPDILDYEARYLEPQVVICEQTTPAVREYAICWVETETAPDLSLAELISVVDRAEVLARERDDTEVALRSSQREKGRGRISPATSVAGGRDRSFPAF